MKCKLCYFTIGEDKPAIYYKREFYHIDCWDKVHKDLTKKFTEVLDRLEALETRLEEKCGTNFR